jgi:hypothetical protein
MKIFLLSGFFWLPAGYVLGAIMAAAKRADEMAVRGDND